MIRALSHLVKRWERDRLVHCIFLSGRGDRSFCVGRDQLALYNTAHGDNEQAQQLRRVAIAQYLEEEYMLHLYLGLMDTPTASLMDGLTLGSGCALNWHSKFRLATERSIFALPDAAIGYFPDLGASWFLPRLNNHLGVYLALTGRTLHGADLIHAGLATHFVPSYSMDLLFRSADTVVNPGGNPNLIDDMIDTVHDKPEGEFSLESQLGVIDRCFGGASVEDVFESVKAISTDDSSLHSGWAKDVLADLGAKSPLALKVTFESMMRGKSMFDRSSCLQMEHRVAQRFVSKSEWLSGVKRIIIDRQLPRWESTLDSISDQQVAEYFEPLPSRELPDVSSLDPTLLVMDTAQGHPRGSKMGEAHV
jgi:enoyl-CoA hydratase/carnithine racemase